MQRIVLLSVYRVGIVPKTEVLASCCCVLSSFKIYMDRDLEHTMEFVCGVLRKQVFRYISHPLNSCEMISLSGAVSTVSC